SFYEWEHSASLFSLEASLTPIQGLNVYGQFMFNQIQSAYEVEHYGADAIPNARGWRGGLGYTLPLGPGFLGLQAEYTHTDPWLYIRENPYITYSWRRKVTSNVNGSVLVTLPLGFEHGPDNDAFWASASFSVPGLGSARIVGEYRVQ